MDTQTGWGRAGQELQESRGVCMPSLGPCPDNVKIGILAGIEQSLQK